MAKQQARRRRKKYQAGSAYAGHVRPSGILGFMSSGNMIKLIFVGMALALLIGGAAQIFGGNIFRQSSSQNDFVLPDDNAGGDATPVIQSDFVPRQYASAPDLAIDSNASYVATIRTAMGDIEVDLLPGQAPETVNNFVFLAEDGFYNGLTFHYVDPGFEALAGDPACSVEAPPSLCRGNGDPGYELDEDINGAFTVGTLGMVNGSQFFIALAESDQFDGFVPFGTIVSGLDVAEQLTKNTQIDSIDIRVQ